MGDVVLSSTVKKTILSLNRSENSIAEITKRLATGLDVNSALDQPDNFFTSRVLNGTAKDLSALLDGIGQNIRTVETALTGLEASEKLVQQAQAIAQTSKEAILAGEIDPAIVETEVDVSPTPLRGQILAQEPIAYFPLSDGTLSNIGTSAAITASNDGATTGATALYNNGGTGSVQFNGGTNRITVSNSPLINENAQPRRTVELVFNADDVTARQVLYEEGATVNGLTIYIDNGLLYVTAEDDQGGNRYSNININAPIQTGTTYHVGFVLDAPGNTFTGYLNGEEIDSVTLTGDATFPSHSGGIGIGGVNGGVQFHDGESGTANGFNFTGRISDVAIHNEALDASVFERHANALNATTSIKYTNRDYDNVVDQINQIANDANYRGINLLKGETLRAIFNPEQTSYLDIEGQNFTEDGFGLRRSDFNDLEDVELILDALEKAQQEIRAYTSSLVNQITVLQTRLSFTEQNVQTNQAGADDLTLSDQNQTAAELLASQTRQSLGFTALALVSQSQSEILRLF